jgi:Na+/H+-dicarboxylate symporter
MKLFRGLGAVTGWSLAALVAACLLGVVAHSSGSPFVAGLARTLGTLGDLWLVALQVVVLPLVIFHVMAVVVAARDSGAVGALGVRAVLLFVTMLVAVGLFTVGVAATIVARVPADRAMEAALAGATPASDASRDMAAGSSSIVDRLGGLVPANPFAAALAGNVLPLLLLAMLVAFVVTRLPDEWRDPLSRGIRATAGATLTLTRWVLWLLPLGVFVLVFPMVLETGGGVTGFLGKYVVVQCILVLIVILLLYPVTSLLGRTSLAAFARGVAPAQLVAASTRSSIASLPALVQGGRERLRLPASATGVVLPLAVALFKLSRTVSAPLRLFVLAQLYHIPLSATTVAIFIVTVILLSFGTVGLPSGVLPIPTLPAYVAAGIPIEGVVILEAVDAIPDIFKTVLNVTGDMSAATILARSSRDTIGVVSAEGEGAPLPDAA